MAGLERRENRTTSHTSEMGPNHSADFAPEKESCSLDSRVTDSITEWTNEKHSLYLKSMEASFVNQLYNSMDFHGRNSLKGNDVIASRQIHRTPSGQFKVFRGGCWQKVNFERPEFQPNKARDSRGFLASPWIRHFKSEEVSDQNFTDEEIKGEKASNICRSKKMKTEVSDASNHDQVVPLPDHKPSMRENSPEKCVFPAG
ncbi:cold regulated protein [Melia azedarach]|uniref:Cold regulated protein n=1 Tax=Melia azedarach TaxID=155640 RepID=A0ACC1WRC7_MELAZ|nr:cold regulated protein [Melia azedarach]